MSKKARMFTEAELDASIHMSMGLGCVLAAATSLDEGETLGAALEDLISRLPPTSCT